MIIQKKEKVLVVRYSDFIIKDCISHHKDVLERNGYCWFGKMGSRISKKNLDIIMKNEIPKMILHSSKEDYLCNIGDIIFEKPLEGYPEYYKTMLYDKNNFPSTYFKLKNLIPLKKEFLKKFVIVSSRNDLPNCLHKSMNSMFMAECIESFEI